MRILLVEDELRLAEALVYILRKEKYIVDHTDDGSIASDMAETGIYDVIILDRMLPSKDGVSILKDLRKQKIKSAVIFLTAKDTIENRIEGLDAGADDYLVKPFEKEELLARIRALGRRHEKEFVNEKFELNNMRFIPKECVVSIEEQEIKLTIKEMQLLEFLVKNRNQILTKEQILDKVWGFEQDVELNNVELYIFYLRKKIPFGKAGVNLKTIRGIGYQLLEEAAHD